MRRIVSLLLICILLLLSSAVFSAGAAEKPAVHAEAVYLVDNTSGEILYAKNQDKRVYPASTTKIMTALLVYEHAVQDEQGLDRMISANRTAVVNDNLHAEGSTAGIRTGEEMTVRDYLYCLLISSANEAGNVLAEYVSGSIDAFIALMNNRAAELGCKDTHFVNPHGLHDDNHYTTAYDLFLITRAFEKIDVLMDIANTVNYTVGPTNKYDQNRILLTTNYLLTTRKGEKYYYRQARGIKTGYTSPAGNCLVSTAKQNGLSLTCVVLHAPLPETAGDNYAFEDSVHLYTWAFATYSYREIVRKGLPVTEIGVRFALDSESVVAVTSETLDMLVSSEDFDEELVTLKPVGVGGTIDAPVTKGQELGEAEVYYDGELKGRVKIAALTNVQLSNFLYYTDKVLLVVRSPVFIITAVIAVLVFVGYLILMMVYNKRKRKYRRTNYRGR